MNSLSPDSSLRMTSAELRSSASLASVQALRMLGLFMVLPVLAVHARSLPEACGKTNSPRVPRSVGDRFFEDLRPLFFGADDLRVGLFLPFLPPFFAGFFRFLGFFFPGFFPAAACSAASRAASAAARSRSS